MLLILSPAKTLDFKKNELSLSSEIPFPKESLSLVRTLKKINSNELAKLMDVSDTIAKLNVERFQNYSTTFDFSNAKQAILAFKGDVYIGLGAEDFGTEELHFAQKHLRILSGLYGVLRPLDLIQPYRLEMGTSLENAKGKNLYAFWGDKIAKNLNEAMKISESDVLINLASQEYFAAVQTPKIKGNIIHIHFKENRNGKLQVISFNAKKARGMMARFVIQHKIENPEKLKAFDGGGYLFEEKISTETDWVFVK